MASVPKNWRIGRFSDGQEQLPESERRMRIGRFSDGQEQHGMIAVSGRFGAPSPERRAAA
jgi:hypothetical protein